MNKYILKLMGVREEEPEHVQVPQEQPVSFGDLECLTQDFALTVGKEIKQLEPCRRCYKGLRRVCTYYRPDTYNKNQQNI